MASIEVHSGLGYAVVGASVARRGPNDVKFLSLPEVRARTRILAVSRQGEQSPLVASMLATLKALPTKRGRSTS